MNSTILKGLTATLYKTIQLYHPIKTLSPLIEELVRDYASKDMPGLQKHQEVINDLKAIRGEMGSIALGVLNSSFSYLLYVAVGLAHSYLSSRGYLPKENN